MIEPYRDLNSESRNTTSLLKDKTGITFTKIVYHSDYENIFLVVIFFEGKDNKE